MAGDPIVRLARLRIIQASAELEVQLATKAGSAPALVILEKLRDEAAKSLAGLVFINYDDPADIIKAKVLSNEVKRYDEWIGWLGALIAEGKQFDQEMTQEDREEMLDVLLATPEGQQEAIDLGLVKDDRSQD